MRAFRLHIPLPAGGFTLHDLKMFPNKVMCAVAVLVRANDEAEARKLASAPIQLPPGMSLEEAEDEFNICLDRNPDRWADQSTLCTDVCFDPGIEAKVLHREFQEFPINQQP